MNLIPETQKALKIKSPGQVHLVARSAVPHLEADEIIVRVVFVAVNPVDGKSADQSPTIGATLGCDFSGEVVARGSTVSKSMEIGDRVCGCIFGNNPDRLDNGAFSEYVAVPANLVFKVPSQLSYQVAATLGVGLSTVGIALYHALKLPTPSSPVREPRYVLVHGGGTATGALAIQMLRL
jgi:aspyridone synthetase trans-acting enoyl reductase